MFPDTFLGIGLYEVCIMVGMLVALFTADKLATRRGFSVGLQKQLILCALAGILSGFFGAVLFQGFYDFLDTGKFSLKEGMTFYGGILVGVPVFLAVWFFGSKPFKLDKEAREKFPILADIGAGLLPLAHGFGRIGCFFAGCCHGQETDAWYGVMMHGVKVVPVQLYEAIFLFLLAGGILTVYFLREKGKIKWEIPLLPIYMAVYGIWRFLYRICARRRSRTNGNSLFKPVPTRGDSYDFGWDCVYPRLVFRIPKKEKYGARIMRFRKK